jgi:hypothetical protein
MGNKSKFNILILFLFVCNFVYSQERIGLSWNASTDNVGVEGYNIWVDGEYNGTSSDTTYELNLDYGSYMVAVSAFDAAGNESDLSDVLIVNVLDTEAPSTPRELMSIYPNPSNGLMSVRFNYDIPDGILQLYTPTGKLVYERDVSAATEGHVESFDFSNFPEQPYVLVLTKDSRRIGKVHLKIT